MNEKSLAWDDLRTILAIAQAGSLAGAARGLGVSHATVFRRLGGIEQRLGVRLFERDRAGYNATPAGEELAAAAQRIESEVLEAERRVAGRDLRPSGTVRVTTTDTLLIGLLSPVFADFRAACPDIALEVAVSNLLFSLSKREADVAIRPTQAPPENLVGRRVGTIAQAVYGSAAVHAPGDTLPEPGECDWVGPDDSMAYRQVEAWMAEHGADARCRYRADTLMGMLAAVRDGIGLATLPCYLGDAESRLVRFGGTIPELSTDLWVLSHPDLRGVARIRAFTDFVAQAVRGMEHRLSPSV